MTRSTYRLPFGRLLLAGVALLAFSRPAAAEDVPQALGLEELLEKSDLVMVATVESVAWDPVEVLPPPAEPPTSGLQTGGGLRKHVETYSFRPSGTYELTPGRILKGKPIDRLRVKMPKLLHHFYGHGFFEVKGIDVKKGLTVLVMLKQEEGGTFSVVDPFRPFVPVVVSDRAPAHEMRKGALSQLLLDTLGHPDYGPIASTLLRDFKDPVAAKGMAQFAKDPDIRRQMDALRCMAVNNDVAAIPLIVAFERDSAREGSCAYSLSLYRAPEAVPELNRALLEGSDAIRRGAAVALWEIGDESSIPALMSALERDDREELVSFMAYRALCRIAGPSFGPLVDRDGFRENQESHIKKLKDWAAKRQSQR